MSEYRSLRREAKFGGGEPNLVELRRPHRFDPRIKFTPIVIKTYFVQWKKPVLDYAELVQKRYIEGWNLADLSRHFGRSVDGIQAICQDLKRRNWVHDRVPKRLANRVRRAVRKF
jgi:hypothetical protein